MPFMYATQNRHFFKKNTKDNMAAFICELLSKPPEMYFKFKDGLNSQFIQLILRTWS